MTMTMAAVMYSRVESKPENTLLKSAKYPAGPVTYTPSPPVSAWAMDRISSTRGASSSQPLPSSATLTGTTTCNARPSLAGTGPMTFPVTSWTPANRWTAAAAVARARAGVVGRNRGADLRGDVRDAGEPLDVGGDLGPVGRGDGAVGAFVDDQGREHVAGREPLGQLHHLGRLGVLGQPGGRVVLLGAVQLPGQRAGAAQPPHPQHQDTP